MRRLLLMALFWAVATTAFCSHIVGGELSYTCSGSNQYHITLKLYRDCNCTNCAPFGNPEYLAIFNALGTMVAQPPMPFPGADTLSPTYSSPCLIPPSVCIEQAIYTCDVTLPNSPGGYTIVYQRCCRNNGVVNMVTGQGATYTVEIPDSGQAVCNSSPHFNSLPPLFICVNGPVTIDYSATDPNGDSLVYSLCDPYDGANTTCPDPSPNSVGAGCPTAPPPPPYILAAYTAPYSSSNFTNSPSNAGNFTIDPHTGLLTGTPNTIGLFDVTVCVSEYRNGQLLGQLRRDFEFTVAQCNTPIAAIPQIGTNSGTGIYIVDCESLTVNFINNSYNPPPANEPIYYAWNFGVVGSTTDTSTQVSPTFTYPDTGIYRVQLIANKAESGGGFCADTTYSLVYVYPTFTSNFSVANICQNATAHFIDSTQSAYGHILGWNWNFGDGTVSNQQNPNHNYTAPGTYTVTLMNGNALGCSDTAVKTVTVFPKPNGNFTDSSFCLGLPTYFKDTASNIISYNWNFGDGTPGSTIYNPSHIFAASGNYTVTLIVQATGGCLDTVSKVITIDPLPDAHFIFTPSCAGSPVTFADTTGIYAAYHWSFGDGSAASISASPSHTYTTTGTYTITLSVQTAHGCADTVSEQLTTLPSPVVAISADTTICRYGSAQLNAGGGVAYVWQPAVSLNNANISDPVANPAATTIYHVRVTNDFNCSTNDSVKVTVFALSHMPFVSDIPCVQSAVTFHDTSSVISSYNWNFGDGSANSSQANPSHVYTSAGTYTITLIVQSTLGCRDTEQQSLIVYPLPNANFTYTAACVNVAGTFADTAGGISAYLWNFGDGSSATTAQPGHAYTNSGSYRVSLVVTSIHGCVDSSSRVVSPYPLPVVIASNDTIVCPSSNIQLFASGGVTYLWIPATGLTDSAIANPVANITSPATYTVYVTDQNNCTNSDSVKITLLPLIPVEAGPDFEIDKGQTVQINATTTGTNIVWTPALGLSNANILNPTASPDSTTAYILTVTGPNGCLATDTMTVHILKDGYAFPNAFTPNGDGKNDLFYPVLMADVSVVNFRIYNRWGALVYENPTRGWDGKFDGKDQPAGTFVYYAILRIPNSLEPSGHKDVKHEGAFSLLR